MTVNGDILFCCVNKTALMRGYLVSYVPYMLCSSWLYLLMWWSIIVDIGRMTSATGEWFSGVVQSEVGDGRGDGVECR